MAKTKQELIKSIDDLLHDIVNRTSTQVSHDHRENLKAAQQAHIELHDLAALLSDNEEIRANVYNQKWLISYYSDFNQCTRYFCGYTDKGIDLDRYTSYKDRASLIPQNLINVVVNSTIMRVPFVNLTVEPVYISN